VKRVVLVAHKERPEAGVLAAQAVSWLHERGHRGWLFRPDAEALGLPALGSDDDPASADLAISLGGDGTMLRTVDLVAAAGVPILGVNVGLLGYLTEVDPGDLVDALEAFFAGRYELEERMMLAVEVQRASGGGPVAVGSALNEAAIEKQEAGHTIRLFLTIDGTRFTSYAADGLIVATPTGSTAYALSARGPIVSPRHRAILVTPVSPHMLFDRTRVLGPDEPVEIEVMGPRPAQLALDGRPLTTLLQGDTVSCRPADHVAKLVRFRPHHFHQILKTKFGLSDR
jgi:NAD+ kinase